MDYFETTFPEPFTILGKKLKPFSLGHLLILHRLDCVPVSDNDSLLMSVLVCSQDATTLDDIFDDRWLNTKLWVWQFLLGKVDWIKCHELWSEYFTLHMAMPSYHSKNSGDDDSPSGTPFLQSLKATLQAKLNYTPKEALLAPMQSAIWDYLSYHEMEGNLEVVDKDWRKEMKADADAKHDELVKAFAERSKEDGS